MVKVAFLGPTGTYSHQAALQQFPDAELIPVKSISGCFDIIDTNDVDYSVIPLENSTNGSVIFTYDLLRDWFMRRKSSPESASSACTGPEFRVVAEQYVAIHHCLITSQPVDKISRLYSHPQVWGQISHWLKAHPGIERIDTSSTSRAVELSKSDPGSAGIASKMASEVFDTPIAEANIEDDAGNTTRFLVLANKNNGSSLSTGKETSTYITLMAFTVAHDDPGALANVLNILKINNMNLSSIQSRPSLESRWHYVMFVEFYGNYAEPEVQNVVKEMAGHALSSSVIGCFPRNQRYYGEQ